LFKRSYFKQLAKNFSWMMLDQAIKILVGFLISVYVIRYLGPKDFGILSYATAIVGVLYPFATLGTDAILFRNMLKNKQGTFVYMDTTQVIRLAACVPLVFFVAILVAFVPGEKEFRGVLWLMLVGLIFDTSRVYKEYFLSNSQNKYIAISSISSVFASNFVKLLLILFGFSVVWFGFAYVVAKSLDFLSLRYIFRNKNKNKNKTRYLYSRSVASSMLRDSWPLIFTSFAGLLYLSVDQILVGNILGYEQLGIYSAGTKLVLVLYVVPSVISNILYPKVIALHKSDSTDSFVKKLEQVYFICLLMALVIFLFYLVFGRYLIDILFGAEYGDSVVILQIYSLSILFVFFNSMNNKLLMIDNLQKLMLSRNVFGLIVNAVLGISLIPKYGVVGAAIGTALAQIFLMLSYGMHKRTRYILWLQLKAFVYPYYFLKERK